MGTLFNTWLSATKRLQEEVYGADYTQFHSDNPDDLRALIEYFRWNMLAIDDEMSEVRQAMSWKPWQHDEPYVDRHEVMKECVDVLHFVANILCAAGATDEELDAAYVAKMQLNANRQRAGYRVLDDGAKCRVCTRALDEYDANSCRESACPQRNVE